jgi:hypothetical protein
MEGEVLFSKDLVFQFHRGQVIMTTKVLWMVVLLELACSPVAKDQMGEEERDSDKVFIYRHGVFQEIQEAAASDRIVKEAIRLFAEADDIYWKGISLSHIEAYRETGCVEVIFENPREIVIEAVKERKIISKLLIPLDKIGCSGDAYILYGDPDYDTFNLLLNSGGSCRLHKMLQAFCQR